MTPHHSFLKAVVERVLRLPGDRAWTVQGFGMQRTYVGPVDDPKGFRLNVWDSRLTVSGVSTTRSAKAFRRRVP
jgi:hypothetical protein